MDVRWPGGGLLSALYANVTCAYQEHQFLSKYKNTLTKHMTGIRQMDDLILFIHHEKNDKEMKKPTLDDH